jgi:uncharacterized membrane protein YuzA (DUF378 family)
MKDSPALCTICKVVYALVIIGALNWGLIGIGDFMGRDFNVVYLLLGGFPTVESIVYILVGLAAVFKLINPCKCGKDCGTDKPAAGGNMNM